MKGWFRKPINVRNCVKLFLVRLVKIPVKHIVNNLALLVVQLIVNIPAPEGLVIDWSNKDNTELITPPNKAWCVLKSHRLLTGESPVPVSVRTPDSRQPMRSGD